MHGRKGNLISVSLKAECVAYIRKLQSTQRKFKWYCRHNLWAFVEQLSKTDVSELPIDEFSEALAFIDKH